MDIRTYFLPLVLVGAFLFSPLEGVTKRKAESRLKEVTKVFERQQASSDTRIPAATLKDAYGIIIMKQYRAGFIFGAKGGHGIAMARDQESGEWSAPTYLKSGEGSFGLQIGGGGVDTIYVIRTESGLDILEDSRLRAGVNVSAAAGPVGREAEAKLGPETAVLAYAKSRGLYAGATVEGGGMWNDLDANEAMYGKPYRSDEILFENAVDVPGGAERLIELIEKYSE